MARFQLPPAEPMKLVPLAEIAKGGMGSVELARAEGGRLHGTPLAIKRLHPNVAQDPQFVAMFFDEAWMTAALKSPNVVQVAAFGTDEKGMFLAVELVQGVSLSRLIKESRQNKEAFAERTVAYLGSQICTGMAAAHGLRDSDGALVGLVHRDLTPGNILVSFDGIVKIADFGIAKAEERITHTRTGTLKGKPSYMAPEQARGGKVDGRSDIFSFGVLMYELLAGRRPWMAKAAFDVMMAAANDPAPDLASLRKGCNPMLVELVHRCLEKSPDDRWSTAGEIQAQLDGWRRSRGFDTDDTESLSGFVRRNTTRQLAWFESALQGDFTKPNAPTFKEIEEKIDEAREAVERGPRPAAGRAALAQMTPTQPKPSAQAPPRPIPKDPLSQRSADPSNAPITRDPLAQRLPDASSARTIPYDPTPKTPPPSKREPLVDVPNMQMTIPLGSPGLPALPQGGPSPAALDLPPKKRVGLAGTEFMEMSPMAGSPDRISAPPGSLPPGSVPPAGSGHDGDGYARVDRSSHVHEPTHGLAARLPTVAAMNAAQPTPPQRPRSRGSLVVLLLVLPFVGFGAVTAWQYRHRIFTPRTPAPPPTALAEPPASVAPGAPGAPDAGNGNGTKER